MKQVFSLALTHVFSRDLSNDVGKLRVEDGNIYRLVRNKTGGALAVGDVVFHGTSDYTFGEIYKVNQASKGTNLGLMAGVVLAVSAADDYQWIQVWGYNASILTLGHASNVVGAGLIGVNDQFHVTFSTGLGTAPVYPRLIVSGEAYTTVAAALKKGWIRCL